MEREVAVPGGPGGRALRSDAERTVRRILEAAERVLRDDPTATMERIAEAAGVARTTIHRRFTSREALIDAMTLWAAQQFDAAVRAGRPDTLPPLVALYQVTANVLRVKSGWGFAMSRPGSADPEVERIHARVLAECDRLFLRARDAGDIRADVDLVWARRVYYALIHEATRSIPADGDTDALASRVVDTLLRGIGSAT
ncbi:TetR/AcrR family transcriptional regulator [Marinitenerispora sediminis]|uniref:TetR family transcriptional regulator n=1 Tax=Marinitenerispora sediminis TaxID=1931232 RepID=A0A368T367_9ACTN|nr:TetR/AcrR family transcriptional regulator [Marinitenerispora sediminis]RCV51937.1 TetR family transcriptional regulator [Marinitenerispora sediminis]RCV53159.1 TetR family transcriptional regulator [Marinitenerispora sediminis]RCV56098.1 TetR family transcriptional regulator [Marinitenerispora sediminis]